LCLAYLLLVAMWFLCCCVTEDASKQVNHDIKLTPRPTLLSSKNKVAATRGVFQTASKAAEGDQPLDFATSAAQGRTCTVVAESSGERIKAEYSVDADLGQLIVKPVGQIEQQEIVVCPIMLIRDIYTIEDGTDCFPRHVVESLSCEERERLFLIELAADDDNVGLRSLYLVEASKSARDKVLQHLYDVVCF